MQSLILHSKVQSFDCLSFNRPHKRNALNLEILKEFLADLQQISKNRSPGLIIRGEGSAFCAGGDLNGIFDPCRPVQELFEETTSLIHQCIETICSMEKLVMAAVTGPAWAAGFGIALACDLIVASKSATFSLSFNKLGLTPNAGVSYFLPKIIGVRESFDAFLTTKTFSGVEARELKIVQHLWEPNFFEENLNVLVSQYLSSPINSWSRMKRLLGLAALEEFHSHLREEKKLICELVQESGFQESVAKLSINGARLLNRG